MTYLIHVQHVLSLTQYIHLKLVLIVRQRAMPHITQIGAVEMESGEAFSTYVLPKISIEPEAEQATGTVYDGTSVFAHGLKNAAVPIREALSNYLKWLSTLRN